MARDMIKGTAKFFWVNTIADTDAPDKDEIIAGLNITKSIATVNGFTFANQPIMTPDMDSRFTSQIAGEDTTEDSSLEMYDEGFGGDTDTVYEGLVKDDIGYVVIFPHGLAGATPAAADVADIWPATITSKSRQYSSDNTAGMYLVSFALTDPPTFDVALVA